MKPQFQPVVLLFLKVYEDRMKVFSNKKVGGEKKGKRKLVL